MPDRAYADITGNFRRGQADAYSRAGDYDRAARVVGDPELAQSYAAMGDRQRARQLQDETRAYGRSYADALHRGDYAGAGAAAARYGDPEGVQGARTAQIQFTQQEREQAYRAIVPFRNELRSIGQAPDVERPNLYGQWRARVVQATQANPELSAWVLQNVPEAYSPRIQGAMEALVEGMLNQILTPEQIATLQQQQQTRANQGWSLDAYGRPYQNDAGVIYRRNEAGERVADTQPVPVPRDRVPAPAAYGPSGLTDQQIDNERAYATQWDRVYQNFSEVRNEFGRIQQMSNRRDAAGDLALVVSFTKMLDPGSVAREGEVALTQSAASALAQAQNFLPRLQQGNTLLPDDVRAQLLSAAQQMYGVYEGAYNRLGQSYYQSALEYGFEPRRVMRGYQPPTPRGPMGGDTTIRPTIARPEGAATAPLAPPQPGAEEDGFRFTGGDPADPNNWEPVR